MTDIFPQSVQGAGTVRVQLVTALATPTAPLTTEINATSSLDCTPYFRADAFAINMEQATNDDTRLSDVAAREQLGLAAFNAEAMRYIHQPQAPSSTPGNKAYEKLVPGLAAYFVLRFGSKTLLSGAAFATGQRVQVYAINCGEQHQPIPSGDNAVHVIEQKITMARTIGSYTLV